jgi:signal transduction histidine kinase
MTWAEPPLFVAALLAMCTLGALIPLEIDRQRRDYVVLTITATLALAVLGPRGLLLVWGSVLVTFMVQRGHPWLLATAVAVTGGFTVAHTTYTVLMGRSYPMRIASNGDFAVAAMVLTLAWLGTTSVRLGLYALSTGPAERERDGDGFDAFDSPLVPYLLPAVTGAPILAAAIAVYRPDDPWSALAMLLWCLPVYAVCRFDLHRQRLARRLRRDAAARQRLAAIGEVTARIVHQSRHQAGLMGWSIHRLRRLVAAAPSDVASAASHELDVLATAKQRIQETLDGELFHDRTASTAVLEPSTLGGVVQEVCDQLSDKAGALGLSLSVSVSDDASGCAVHPSLRTVLYNLVDNAADAARGQVAVSAELRGADVMVSVTDDGPGIPDAAATRLYEPFFSTKPDGTGMGLAIADTLVADLGGHLTHTSDPTHFTFTLPAAIS